MLSEQILAKFNLAAGRIAIDPRPHCSGKTKLWERAQAEVISLVQLGLEEFNLPLLCPLKGIRAQNAHGQEAILESLCHTVIIRFLLDFWCGSLLFFHVYPKRNPLLRRSMCCIRVQTIVQTQVIALQGTLCTASVG